MLEVWDWQEFLTLQLPSKKTTFPPFFLFIDNYDVYISLCTLRLISRATYYSSTTHVPVAVYQILDKLENLLVFLPLLAHISITLSNKVWIDILMFLPTLRFEPKTSCFPFLLWNVQKYLTPFHNINVVLYSFQQQQ